MLFFRIFYFVGKASSDSTRLVYSAATSALSLSFSHSFSFSTTHHSFSHCLLTRPIGSCFHLLSAKLSPLLDSCRLRILVEAAPAPAPAPAAAQLSFSYSRSLHFASIMLKCQMKFNAMLKCLKIVFGFPFALAFCKAVWKNIPNAKCEERT